MSLEKRREINTKTLDSEKLINESELYNTYLNKILIRNKKINNNKQKLDYDYF